MKKKCLIIFSIMQFLLSVINFFNIDNNYSKFISETQDFSLVLKNGFIIMHVVLCLISLLFLLIIFLNRENKYYKTLIFILILNIIFGTLINTFMSIILILLLKKENKNIENKDSLTYSYSNLEFKKAVIAIILFLFIPSLLNKLSFNSNLLQLIKSIVLMAVMIFIFKNDLVLGIKDFKSNIKENIKYVISSQVKIMLIYITACVIEMLVLKGNITMSVNEQEVEKLPLLLLSFLAIIEAPIVEECVFRLSLRKIIKNKWLFTIISGVLFGFVHTISEPSVVRFIAISLPYVAAGLSFAYYYQKKNNIIYPMLFHAFHNGIMCLLILFVR